MVVHWARNAAPDLCHLRGSGRRQGGGDGLRQVAVLNADIGTQMVAIYDCTLLPSCCNNAKARLQNRQ